MVALVPALASPPAPGQAVARVPSAEPRIWAVGSGKGGVGKSLIASSLAIAFAERGQRCALVDADLGGANLHTLLGLGTPERTIADFLNRQVDGLSQVMIPTPFENLSLISGARALDGTANPKHLQKEKLLRHISQLAVDHVFLDLGAGSAFNVLDFFLGAHRGLLVIGPEPTSIENAYHFLKAAFYRWLRKEARRSPVRSALEAVLAQKEKRRIRTPRELIAAVREVDREAGDALDGRAREFAPMLVLNQARSAAHRCLGAEIAAACRQHLGISLEYVGAVDRDESVFEALTVRRPVLARAPSCSFSRALRDIAARLVAPPESQASAQVASAAGSRSKPLAASLARELMEVVARSEGDISGREGAAAAVRRPTGLSLLPEPGSDGPGAYLRRCREHLGLGWAELARRTRIRWVHFESIEREYFDRLPPEAHTRRFVLEYARTLGVSEPESLTARYIARLREATAAA